MFYKNLTQIKFRNLPNLKFIKIVANNILIFPLYNFLNFIMGKFKQNKAKIHTIGRSFDVHLCANPSSTTDEVTSFQYYNVNESLYSFARAWFMSSINQKKKELKEFNNTNNNISNNSNEISTPIVSRNQAITPISTTRVTPQTENQSENDTQSQFYNELNNYFKNNYVPLQYVESKVITDKLSMEQLLNNSKRRSMPDTLRGNLIHSLREQREKRGKIARIRFDQARVCLCKRIYNQNGLI